MTPDIADAARAILRQYNESGDSVGGYRGYKFQGPHFVVYNRSDFFLHPYGAYPHHRYSFHVTPDYDFGKLEEPLWIFNVL